jgi:hypothetical protein
MHWRETGLIVLLVVFLLGCLLYGQQYLLEESGGKRPETAAPAEPTTPKIPDEAPSTGTVPANVPLAEKSGDGMALDIPLGPPEVDLWTYTFGRVYTACGCYD